MTEQTAGTVEYHGRATTQPARALKATAAGKYFKVSNASTRAAELANDVRAIQDEIKAVKGKHRNTFMTLDDFEQELDG